MPNGLVAAVQRNDIFRLKDSLKQQYYGSYAEDHELSLV